ncbi:Vacuolar protein-sorting-associated protein 36 [Mycena sanguinolenta]|uniref:Vacuolar protein-sorting-associated protein 36 n=1 Tax=Mycena sanguinolenta TaxID=230812 RepID=A0A8H7DHA6_9AGAR|nr:Vacuolar protein-sorting-associated protein 36 [Mycena sanguinolenta]
MTLRRCTKSVDGTIPIPALLYNDEELLSSQDGVGIYDGIQKSPNHQLGTIHVTTHRLFYISTQHEATYSFALDLSCVSQTDHYAGLFKSSAKVTLYISVPFSASGDAGSNDGPDTPFESWECQVCGYRNPPGLSPAAARVCGLCGISRDSVPAPPAASSSPPLSSSLPASSSLPSLHPPWNSPRTHQRQPSAIACPACTFLNHPSLRSCEICATDLPLVPALVVMKSAPSSRPASPDPSDDDDVTASRIIKISFRKGGDKAFYGVLRTALKSKAWTVGVGSNTPASGEAAAGDSSRSGITGILRNVESSAQGRATDMTDAFQDLEALRIKARDMVRFAAELNERLTASSTTAASALSLSDDALIPSTEPEEATFIRSSLSQLGLEMSNTPVTLDMMKDERRWIEQLARELASVLQGSSSSRDTRGMMKERGIIALDEVWGGWNRARGVALLPPTTLLQVIPHLGACTTPTISMRTFPSGLSVLHTPPYSHVAFAARLSGLLALSGPKTTTEIAREEHVTVGLAAEMIGAVEADGDICRDDEACAIQGGGAEVRFWGNIFHGSVWDGQPITNDV